MAVDLSDPGEKPGLSAEALLRALQVSYPGGGISYESAARVSVVALDLALANPDVARPEAGYQMLTTPVPGAGIVAGLQVNAGPRGCWLYPVTDTSGAFDLELLAFDDEAAAAAAGGPTTVVGAWPVAYQRNGGVQSIVSNVTFPDIPGVPCMESIAGNQGSILAGFFTGGRGIWIPPGGIGRAFNGAPATAMHGAAFIREPLAP